MDLERFQSSLESGTPPRGVGALLQALWYEARGDWARAHQIVQAEGGRMAAAVHAYLHRREGDLANADYWYERAARKRPTSRLATEWEGLVNELLARGK